MMEPDFDGIVPSLHTLAAYSAYFKLFDEAVIVGERNFFVRNGLFRGAGERLTLSDLIAKARVVPKYQARLFPLWIENLVAQGDLEYVGREVRAKRALATQDDGDIWRQAEALVEAAGIPRKVGELFQRLASRAGDILQGKVMALEFFLPKGSTEIPELLYEKMTGFAYLNQVCRRVIRRLREIQPNPSVLEIGAGVGGCTQELMKELPSNTPYCYTDISPFFFLRARERFGSFSQFQYQVFNLNQRSGTSALGDQRFDLLVASNSFHCAKSLADSLTEARERLNPAGRLLLIELTRADIWHTFVMGTAEGFFSFEDQRSGPYTPLLNVEGWQSTLAAAGFPAFEYYPREQEIEQAIGGHVILAGR